MSTVRKDDGPSGAVAAVANPPGWLHVTVDQIGANPVGQFDFSGWQSFRQWVELSDPGFATAMAPLK